MKITHEDGQPVITCECGFRVFYKGVLRTRVSLVNNGFICIKCPRCKRFDHSVNMQVLMQYRKT